MRPLAHRRSRTWARLPVQRGRVGLLHPDIEQARRNAYMSSGKSRSAVCPVKGRILRKWRSEVNMAFVR